MKRLIRKADIDRQRCEEVKEKLKQEGELKNAAFGLGQFAKYIIGFVETLDEYKYLDGGEKVYIQELIFLHRELIIDLFGEEMFQNFMKLVSLSNIENEKRMEELMQIAKQIMQVTDIYESKKYH